MIYSESLYKKAFVQKSGLYLESDFLYDNSTGINPITTVSAFIVPSSLIVLISTFFLDDA